MRIILIITAMITTNISAQTFGDEGLTLTPNRLGLVYEGAIEKNVTGQVNVHKVNYRVEGIPVSANVYTPIGYNRTGAYPAIVVAHPNGGSKEQVAGLYAQRLAEAGFITIAFDARYQGESGGKPRRTDKPALRIGDISGAVDFIENYPAVDKNRIGAFGICGGGGYTFATAQADKRIKAVATLSLFNTGEVRRNGYMRTQTSTITQRQEEASQARQREASGEKPELIGFANMTPEEARALKVDLYREGYFYYAVTHKTPNAPGSYLKSSLMDMMAWDATDHADLITQPLLIIAGEKADSRYMSEEAFAKATGTADKELFIVPEATHIKTYYVPEYVSQITAKIQDFFTHKLRANPAIHPQTKILTPQQELTDLSNRKWQWMAEKNTERLAELFHQNAQFVHMGGTWGKEAELNIIKTGGIWYKKADIHSQEVKLAERAGFVYSNIHLTSEVGGREVTFPFMVTEVFVKENGKWQLASLVFTRLIEAGMTDNNTSKPSNK